MLQINLNLNQNVNTHTSQLYNTNDSVSSLLSKTMLISTPVKSQVSPPKPSYLIPLQEHLEITNNSFNQIKNLKYSKTRIEEQDKINKEHDIKSKELTLNDFQHNLEKKKQSLINREVQIKEILKQFAPNTIESLSALAESLYLKTALLDKKENYLIEKEKNIERQKKMLDNIKEKTARIECSVLLNEIIGCISISDSEEKPLSQYIQEDSDNESIFYGSGNELDQIPEISLEHSSEILDDSYIAHQ